MSEKISMNQETIEVVLMAADEEKDLLRFNFKNDPLDVSLNSPLCQNELKAIFVRLLQLQFEKDVCLKFIPAEGYGRRMYIEVCEEYIKDLNRELALTKEKLLKEIG